MIILKLFIILFSTNIFAKDVFYRNFWQPLYHANRLNYCTIDQKLCGIELAHKYCNSLGFSKASKSIIAHNIGKSQYFSTRHLCNNALCNGFKLIQCEQNEASTPKVYSYRFHHFPYPRLENYRVDYCYLSAKNCGQKPADAFCKQMGYLKADKFKREDNLSLTKDIADDKLCLHDCVGFEFIDCFR